MLNRCRGLVVRIGRRGSYLLFLAILDFIYGWALLNAFNPVVKLTDLFLPVTAWAVWWLVTGAVCAVCAFLRDDRIAFMLATLIKFCWGSAMLFSWWLTTTNPLGWISGTLFLAFCAITGIVSFWPEQRRFKIEDM